MKGKSFCSSLIILFFIFISFGITQTDMKKKEKVGKDVEINFRVKWDGKIITGVTQVSELKRNTEVITHRSGGDPNLQRRSPGITEYQSIVIQRPRSNDREFERWANKVWNFGSGLGSEVSLKDFRKDIRIELFTKKGEIIMAFNVYRCWPSEYVALTDLDKDCDSMAMEKLVLEHEGWERDYSLE